MTRAHKRDVDREALRENWEKQAGDLGFDARALTAEAIAKGAVSPDMGRVPVRETSHAYAAGEPHQVPQTAAGQAVAWAVAHLSEREAMFARTDLFATALAWRPGAVTMAAAEREVAALEKAGKLHPAVLAVPGGVFTTDKAVADERETISLMQTGQGRGAGTRR